MLYLLETDEKSRLRGPRRIRRKEKEGADTHQGHTSAVRTHQGLGKGAGVRLPQRDGYPPVEVVDGKGIRGHPQTFQVGLRRHLPKRQPPLRQGKHPPAMNGGNHSRSGEPSFPQLPQGLQKGLEILLSVVWGPVAPVIGGGGHHSLRKRWEPPVVISEIEPPALPPFVRGRKDGGDILRRPRLPQLEDTATSLHCRADPSLHRRQGKMFRGEDMSPQVPVRVNPQVSFTNHREDGGLRDGVRTEVMQLHPVDVQNRPHKTACRHSEPPLVKGDEAHDIPWRQGRGGSAREGIHFGCGSPERGRSKPSATRTSRSSAVTVEKGHGSRGGTMVTQSAITKQKRWRWKGLGERFPFSGYSLGLRKPKKEASSRAKNHHRSLSRIYKGPGETHSTLHPNPPWDSKLKAKHPFLEWLAHAQRPPREPLVPSH
jgi:hypothetical protein